jgi:hypothetical protein
MSTLDLTWSHEHPITIRTILGCPAVLSFTIEKKGLTPVDPAGPDCYQSGTKPCESTLQGVAYGSVTRSQHAQRTWIISGN